MAKFSKGDKVSWNSEEGRIDGEVVKIHEKDFQFMKQQRRASADEPQYEVKSDKTDAHAVHKEDALTKRYRDASRSDT